METLSRNLEITHVPVFEGAQQQERGFTLLIIILLLCMVPDIPGLAIAKIPIAIFLLFLTLPAVLAALSFKIGVVGRGVFLALLLVTVLNIFNALVYHAPILRWLRMAFCSYIFVAIFFYVNLKLNTPSRRAHMWKLLVIFISFASFLDFIAVARYGLAQTFEQRAAGGHAFTLTALMLLFPILGTALAKKKWLLVCFGANMLLLFLSSSRGVYLIIFMGIIYTLVFIQKRFSYRFFFFLFVIIVGAVLINTPIYDRMADRFSSAREGDTSTMARVDEALSVVSIVRKSPVTLLFGKGFGVPWKPEYRLSLGREPELPGGYMSNTPHNDYAARLLYCGLVGLAVQLLLYFIVCRNCFAALRRSRRVDIDIHTKVRLHGAILVIIMMAMQGFTGGVFYSFNNNVYEAFVIGMAMADATTIFSMDKAKFG